jgi:uncharacterized protein YndB with AHSA1/START domain
MTAEYTVALPATPERAFAALTDAAQLTHWWGDDSIYWMTEVRQDVHPGGEATYMFAFADDDAVSGSSAGRTSGSTGVTLAADPPRMLAYTRKYDDGFPCKEETVIRYELEPFGDGTRLRVTHSGFQSEQMVELHRHGWERVFEWLERYLTTHR